MQRSIPWFWIVAVFAILLLPTPAGRILLDLLGGLTLLLLLLPLLVGGAALIGWQLLKRRLRTCEACGMTSLGAEICPACGTPFGSPAPEHPPSFRSGREVDASDVTITVEAVEVEKEEGSG